MLGPEKSLSCDLRMLAWRWRQGAERLASDNEVLLCLRHVRVRVKGVDLEQKIS